MIPGMFKTLEAQGWAWGWSIAPSSKIGLSTGLWQAGGRGPCGLESPGKHRQPLKNLCLKLREGEELGPWHMACIYR